MSDGNLWWQWCLMHPIPPPSAVKGLMYIWGISFRTMWSLASFYLSRLTFSPYGTLNAVASLPATPLTSCQSKVELGYWNDLTGHCCEKNTGFVHGLIQQGGTSFSQSVLSGVKDSLMRTELCLNILLFVVIFLIIFLKEDLFCHKSRAKILSLRSIVCMTVD